MGLFSKKKTPESEAPGQPQWTMGYQVPPPPMGIYQPYPTADMMAHQDLRRHSAIDVPPQDYYQPRARFLSLPADNLPHVAENSYSLINRALAPMPYPQPGIAPYRPMDPLPQASGSIVDDRRGSAASSQLRKPSMMVDDGQPQYPPNPNLEDPTLRPAADFPFVKRRRVIHTLQKVLAKQKKTVDHCIDVEDLESGAVWSKIGRSDGLKIIARDTTTQYRLAVVEREHNERERLKVVFGNDVGNLYEQNASPVNVYGYRHMVPYVLKTCIEALYLSGATFHEIFDSNTADYTRVSKMVKHLNVLHPSRRQATLTGKPVADIGGVLSHYVRLMGDSPFPRLITDALFDWCARPSMQRFNAHTYTHRPRMVRDDQGDVHSASDDSDHESEIEVNKLGLPSFHSKHKKEVQKAREERRASRKWEKIHNPDQYYAKHEEERRLRQEKRAKLEKELVQQDEPMVHAARLVILAMPNHHVSFVIYLFTFLASLNASEEIGGLFGKKLFAGRDCAPAVLKWMLDRWDWIAEGFQSDVRLVKESSEETLREPKTSADIAPKHNPAPRRYCEISPLTPLPKSRSRSTDTPASRSPKTALSYPDPIMQKIEEFQRELEDDSHDFDYDDDDAPDDAIVAPLETEDTPVIVPEGYKEEESSDEAKAPASLRPRSEGVERKPFGSIATLCQIPPPQTPSAEGGPQSVLDLVGAFDGDAGDDASVYSQAETQIDEEYVDDGISDDPAVLKEQLAAARSMLKQMQAASAGLR